MVRRSNTSDEPKSTQSAIENVQSSYELSQSQESIQVNPNQYCWPLDIPKPIVMDGDEWAYDMLDVSSSSSPSSSRDGRFARSRMTNAKFKHGSVMRRKGTEDWQFCYAFLIITTCVLFIAGLVFIITQTQYEKSGVKRSM
ncbi:WGS project CAID00000000 data, contig chromosome 07 [Trichuris trichiura]|uniref:WGS project CAID00000000 data, contig chromosome 07 n=1 Tax=Trichuris trichiura TaxID=36087 RepID=A0A077Z687_TRITR|nr:WGS project CAID00000000 data, contig chromosome 07 [Trichuris trichiura]